MEVVLAGYRMALVIVLAGPFLTLLARMGVETTPSTISGTVGSFQSGGAFAGQRVLTIERLLMSGCGQGHYPQENVSKEDFAQVSNASSKQEWKHRPKKVSIA